MADDIALPFIPTIEQELEQIRAELYQAKDRLRCSTNVDEQIECRLEIGRCTQLIRRLQRELHDGA